MNLARLFHYTQQLEFDAVVRENQLTELRTRLEEQGAAHAEILETVERDFSMLQRSLELRVDELLEDNRGLRKQNAELLDRVAIKLQVIPPSEPITRPTPTAEETVERSTRIDSQRRTGPVAKMRQEAEAQHKLELERQEELRRKDAVPEGVHAASP